MHPYSLQFLKTCHQNQRKNYTVKSCTLSHPPTTINKALQAFSNSLIVAFLLPFSETDTLEITWYWCHKDTFLSSSVNCIIYQRCRNHVFLSLCYVFHTLISLLLNSAPLYFTNPSFFFLYPSNDVLGFLKYVLIQNFPDWRCKNHKTHHRAYSPPSCRHRSQSSPFLERFWKSFSVRMSSTLYDSAWICSMVSHQHPFSLNFICGNRKKSQGAKSGEYSGWGITAILFFARNWWARTEVWDRVLSW